MSNKEEQEVLDVIADGKSAKGYATWTWQSKQQTADVKLLLLE